MAKLISNIPMEKLVTSAKNMYELTNAAIHRAKQITIAGSEHLGEAGGKIVPLAIKEIITEEVQYNSKGD